jgi:hypothetical protein
MRSDLFSLPVWGCAQPRVDLRGEKIDLKTATLHVRRIKNGTPPVFFAMVERAGLVADLGIKLHANMLGTL